MDLLEMLGGCGRRLGVALRRKLCLSTGIGSLSRDLAVVEAARPRHPHGREIAHDHENRQSASIS